MAAATLPPLSSAVKLHFPVFLLSERTRAGSCSFTAVLIGGKVDFQLSSSQRGGKQAIAALPLLSSAVKSIFQFSSALSGGKLEIADMLRGHLAAMFQSDFLSLFPSFCLLVGHGSGLSSTN